MQETGLNPATFVRVYHKHTAGTDLLKWQQGSSMFADPSTYYDGWKEPRLEEIGDIERASSNMLGNFEASRCQIRINDRDQMALMRLDDDTRQIMSGAEAVINFTSVRNRVSEGEARTLFRGLIREYGPNDLSFDYVIEDIIGASLGPFALDKELPQEKIGDRFIGSPKDAADHPIPTGVYGEWSDAGTVDSTGAPFVVGMIPAIYVGDYFVSASGITPVQDPSVAGVQLLLAPPPAPTVTPFGSGGGQTWTYAFVARTTAGGYTTMGAPTTVSGLPDEGQFSPTNGVTITVAEYAPGQQAQVIGLDLWVKKGDASSTNRWYMMDAAGEAFTTGYTDDGDDSHYKSFYGSPPTLNTATITATVGGASGSKKRAFLICAGYFEIHQIFASNLAEPTPQRVDTTSDPSWVWPGGSWPLPNDWVEIGGRRYTMFFGEGLLADHHVENKVTIAVNGCGFTNTGNPGSPIVAGAFHQAFRFLNDWVIANEGTGYLNGLWPANATWPGSDTIEILNWQSFEACQQYTRARMGDSMGWLGHMYLGDRITLREWLRRFSETFDCFFYANQFGQICCGIVDETMDLSDAQPLRDRIELREVLALQIMDSIVNNSFHYLFDYNPDLKKWRSLPVPVEDATSISRHPGGARGEKTTLELWTRDAGTAASAMAHRLMRLAYAPRIYTFKVDYSPGIQLEINTPVLVTSRKVNGVERPMLIVKHRTTVAQGERDGYVTLDCLDLLRIAA